MEKSEKNRVEDQKKCPECGGNVISDEKRIQICEICGLVINETVIDFDPKWHAFNIYKARTGPPTNEMIPDKGLSMLPIQFNSVHHSRLKTAQMRTARISSQEKTLILALNEIKRISSGLQLPNDIQKRTAVLYREIRKKKIAQTKSTESIISALLHFICKEYGVSRTLKEITEFSRVEIKEIESTRKHLAKNFFSNILFASPVDFVPRFCSSLEVNEPVRRKAIEIAEIAEEQGITNGRTPIGISAAAICMAAPLNDQYITQKDISKVTGVSEPTIRNRRNELLELLQQKREKIKTKGVSMEDLVGKVMIETNIAEAIIKTGITTVESIREIAIYMGERAEEADIKKHQKENKEMRAKKNREATAAVALLAALKKEKMHHLAKTVTNNSSVNRNTITKRSQEMREFGILDKK